MSQPELAVGSTAEPKPPLSTRAVWGFGAVAFATLVILLRDAQTFALVQLPPVAILAVRQVGYFTPVLLVVGIVLGHLSVRKRTRGLHLWRLGIAALVLGYGFLLLYLAQVIVILLLILLLNGNSLTF